MLVGSDACFSFFRKCSLCLARFTTVVVFFDHVWSSEICTPRNLMLYTLHSTAADAEGCVLNSWLLEVSDHLLHFVHVEHQVVVSTLDHKLFIVLPVHCFVVFVYESHYCGVIRKLHEQHTALRGSCTQHGGVGDVFSSAHCLWSLSQKIPDPEAGGSVQAQTKVFISVFNHHTKREGGNWITEMWDQDFK